MRRFSVLTRALFMEHIKYERCDRPDSATLLQISPVTTQQVQDHMDMDLLGLSSSMQASHAHARAPSLVARALSTSKPR